MKSWQADLFEELRRREWHIVGDLFEKYEQAIPLHFATRHYVLAKRTEELPSNFEARWVFFRFIIKRIGVEHEEGTAGPRKALLWNTRIRLGYLGGQVCDDCGGPVIRATWSGVTYSCLKCDEPEPVTIAPEPEVIKVPKPEPEPEPEPEPIPPRTPKNTVDELATLSSLKEIWAEYLLNFPNTGIEGNRKLRWILHRAQEMGATESYLWIRPRIFEFLTSRWTWTDIITHVEAHGDDWIATQTHMLTRAERNGWRMLLKSAYRYASLSVIAIAFAGRLGVIEAELSRRTIKLMPKLLPPPSPPKQPPKQRWQVLRNFTRWHWR